MRSLSVSAGLQFDRGGQLREGRVGPLDADRVAGAVLELIDHPRDKVIARLMSGIGTPQRRLATQNWTQIDRDYEIIRLDMQTLLNDLGISLKPAAAQTTACRLRPGNPPEGQHPMTSPRGLQPLGDKPPDLRSRVLLEEVA
jgi:hypothetical protein